MLFIHSIPSSRKAPQSHCSWKYNWINTMFMIIFWRKKYLVMCSSAAVWINIWVDPLCLLFYWATQSPLSHLVLREAPSTLYDLGTIYHKVRGPQWALSTPIDVICESRSRWLTHSLFQFTPSFIISHYGLSLSDLNSSITDWQVWSDQKTWCCLYRVHKASVGE